MGLWIELSASSTIVVIFPAVISLTRDLPHEPAEYEFCSGEYKSLVYSPLCLSKHLPGN